MSTPQSAIRDLSLQFAICSGVHSATLASEIVIPLKYNY